MGQRSQTHCQRGHEFTPANTMWRKEGWRSCRECKTAAVDRYQRRHHKRNPSESGWCRKRLHRWTADNIISKSNGELACRACRRIAANRRHAEGRHPVIPCAGAGCRRTTTRKGDDGYLCPQHRQEPPPWISAAGLRLVGTELRRAA